MKTTIVSLIIVLTVTESSFSQTVNWKSVREDQQNLLQFNFGYDYGVTAQTTYGRIFNGIIPMMVGLDFSFPMGNNVPDDFKIRLGGQIEVLEVGGFSVTARIASVFTRYQTQLVTIESFGSDFGIAAGYCSPTWSLGGEFGFDKAITSHLKHSDLMKEVFPGITDGWYVPTGGHYYYGLQGGKTIGEMLDLSMRVGATSAQADDENPVIPYYLQMGFGVRF